MVAGAKRLQRRHAGLDVVLRLADRRRRPVVRLVGELIGAERDLHVPLDGVLQHR